MLYFINLWWELYYF